MKFFLFDFIFTLQKFEIITVYFDHEFGHSNYGNIMAEIFFLPHNRNLEFVGKMLRHAPGSRNQG